jgi:zinc ribbon protein
MHCTRCGQMIPEGNQFCQHCGSPLTTNAVAAVPPRPIESSGTRMQTHVKVLVWVCLIFGALGCVAGLIVFAIFSIIGGQVPFSSTHGGPFLAPIGFLGLGTLLAGFCLLFSLPGVLAGYGLLNYRPWARILTLILCFLNLLNIPLGTVLGAYGLWVLLSSEGQEFYQQQAALSQGA